MNFGKAGHGVHSSKQFQLLEYHPNKMCIIPIGPTQQLKVKELST
jgi:hypothetical protein